MNGPLLQVMPEVKAKEEEERKKREEERRLLHDLIQVRVRHPLWQVQQACWCCCTRIARLHSCIYLPQKGKVSKGGGNDAAFGPDLEQQAC